MCRLLIFAFQIFAFGILVSGGTAARAGNFAACASVDPKMYQYNWRSHGSCTTFHSSLERLSVLGRLKTQAEDLKNATDLQIPKITALLDRSIDARTKLIQCLDHPEDSNCAPRLRAMRDTITRRMRKYRAALALAGQSNSTSASVDALDPNLRTLPFLGARTLSPLSSAEYWHLREFHDRYLNRIDLYQGHDSSGREMPKDAFIKRCETSHDDPDCLEYVRQRANARVHLREQAKRVAVQTIAEFPLLSFFDKTPIGDTELRMVLVKTREGLQRWRDKVTHGADRDGIMMAYPDLMDEVLSQHPEYCGSIERRYVHNRSSALTKKYALEGAGLAVTGGICFYSAGFMCAAAALTPNAVQALVSSQNYAEALDQFQNSESDKLFSSRNLESAHTDMLMNLAFAGVQALPLGQGAKIAAKGLLGAEEGGNQYRQSLSQKADYQSEEELSHALDQL